MNLKKSRRRHKPSPEVPYYVWLDLDGCWFCKHQNGCNNCKVLKRYNALEKEKRVRREKKKFDFS